MSERWVMRSTRWGLAFLFGTTMHLAAQAVPTADEQKFLELFYRETSTIGIRVRRVERHSLEREVRTVETEFGSVEVKNSFLGGEAVNSQPEFEDLKAVAAAAGVPLKFVADAIAKREG